MSTICNQPVTRSPLSERYISPCASVGVNHRLLALFARRQMVDTSPVPISYRLFSYQCCFTKVTRLKNIICHNLYIHSEVKEFKTTGTNNSTT